MIFDLKCSHMNNTRRSRFASVLFLSTLCSLSWTAQADAQEWSGQVAGQQQFSSPAPQPTPPPPEPLDTETGDGPLVVEEDSTASAAAQPQPVAPQQSKTPMQQQNPVGTNQQPAIPSSFTNATRDEETAPETTMQEPAPESEGDAEQKSRSLRSGFGFGSYGRVGVSSDAEGGKGQRLGFVTHQPRLGEEPYVELDFYYHAQPIEGSETTFTATTTLALNEELFHFNGNWESALALRNLYVEGNDVFLPGLGIWVGSRMYRGDDIYLLDFWPLDSLNTLGGGIHYRFGQTWVGWHFGVNRLRDAYQYQEVAVPGLDNTSETVVLLNRQRYITSLKAEQLFDDDGTGFGSKVKIYGEFHHIGEGTLNAHRPEIEQEQLMADFGWLAGAQYTLWGFGPSSHVHLFARYARGLAAYGEFAIPFGLDDNKRAKEAEEFLTALSGNWEWDSWIGLMLAGYARYFKDADSNKYDWEDGWEYVVAARPQVFLHRHFAIAGELSYQTRNPAGLNPWTGRKEIPGIFKFSVFPMVTYDKGSFARPQLRLIYTLTHQNEAARDMYNPLDPRHEMEVAHYFGLQAEWWFNSTYR